MARQKKEYEGYGSEYLTPYQEILEQERLAPGGAADVGSSLRVNADAIVAANATNPLLAPRDTGLVPTTTEVTPVSTAPNPFTRPTTIQPPVPFAQMGVEQQIAWRTLQDAEMEKQAALEQRQADAEDKRQKTLLATEQAKQRRELMAEAPKLLEALNKDPKEYLRLKADLATRFPVGIGTPEAERALGEYEKIYTAGEKVGADLSKAEIARRAVAQQKRLDALYTQAEKLGPDVARGVASRAEKDPEDASRFLEEEQRKDIIQQGINAGMTEQEIAVKFPGEFPIRAAEAELKRQMTPVQQATQLRNQVSDLAKLRSDVAYYSLLPEPDKAALDANLKRAQAEYNAIQSRGVGDRGVQGMNERALQVAREQAMAYNTGPAQQPITPQQAVVQQPATPAAPGWLGWGTAALPGSVAVGKALTSAYVQPTRLAAQALQPLFGQPPQAAAPAQAAQPAATPAPEPVGTRKVIAGVESVKYPDGKWYKVKSTTQ